MQRKEWGTGKMTRMRQPHSFHETKEHRPETACSKCGTETSRVCEWCGACEACHTGSRRPEKF